MCVCNTVYTVLSKAEPYQTNLLIDLWRNDTASDQISNIS